MPFRQCIQSGTIPNGRANEWRKTRNKNLDGWKAESEISSSSKNKSLVLFDVDNNGCTSHWICHPEHDASSSSHPARGNRFSSLAKISLIISFVRRKKKSENNEGMNHSTCCCRVLLINWIVPDSFVCLDRWRETKHHFRFSIHFVVMQLSSYESCIL